jgi:hypothetical protein
MMSRASGQARPGAHRFTGTATGAMARMFAAWSQVRRSKQSAAYAGRAYGSEEPQVTGTAGHRPFGSCSWDDASGRFGLRSGRSWAAASGSRWAATGVRNDRGARPQTVKGHDRRFCHRRPLT